MELLIVDTVGIQPYIFGSNRLRANIGASQKVAEATGVWAREALRAVVRSHNLADEPVDGQIIDDRLTIESPESRLEAELLYQGGGNILILFQESQAADEFVRDLTRIVLTRAPGLELEVGRAGFQWGKTPLTQVITQAFADLAQAKQSRVAGAPLLGLGVTRSCHASGLPAVTLQCLAPDEEPLPVSTEVAAKLEAGRRGQAADQRLHDQLLDLKQGYDWPGELEDLGRSRGEHSYIAVVHCDGNDLGQRIRDLGGDLSDREMVRQQRRFSAQVEQAAQQALKTVIQELQDQVQGGFLVHPTLEALDFELQYASNQSGIRYLPFRPIVFGGDDVTFVCDGRLGVSLAVEYLASFERNTRSLPGGPASACAGVAIVKSRYPFARAYALAEELCQEAKRYRRKMEIDGSCLDWHFATSGLGGSLEAIRHREYRVGEGSLTLRPVALQDREAQVKSSGRSWPKVRKAVDSFQQEGWWDRRNKVKALRDSLREGRDAVERFRSKYLNNGELPDLGKADWQESGWSRQYCGYFDAIELFDWYIPLREGEVE